MWEQARVSKAAHLASKLVPRIVSKGQTAVLSIALGGVSSLRDVPQQQGILKHAGKKRKKLA